MSKERVMEVVIVPEVVRDIVTRPKSRDLSKLTFKNGRSKGVKAEGVFPEGWDLQSELEVTVTRYGKKGKRQFEAKVPGLGSTNGNGKTARGAIKDMALSMTEYHDLLFDFGEESDANPGIKLDGEILKAKLKAPSPVEEEKDLKQTSPKKAKGVRL